MRKTKYAGMLLLTIILFNIASYQTSFAVEINKLQLVPPESVLATLAVEQKGLRNLTAWNFYLLGAVSMGLAIGEIPVLLIPLCDICSGTC